MTRQNDRAHYPAETANPDFPAIERGVLEYWQENSIFTESVERRPAAKDGANNEFVFYDGPPFANGLPHYGHLLTGFVKDLVARYQTMRGKRVERRFGWDCHGLPAEMGAEKELGISGRQQITNYGIGKFNEFCRTSVMRFSKDWEHYVNRQARWVDFAGDYKTMDKNFMESVLWAFKELYKKGFIYESHRVLAYSWAAETPMSNFETKLDNSFREREDKAITVAFRLKERPKGAPEAENYYVLAWTTTPWTLPSNLALAVSRDLSYHCILNGDNCYLVSEGAVAAYRKELFATAHKDAVLETARLYARPFTMDDLDAFHGLQSDADVTLHFGKSYDREAAQSELERIVAHQKELGFSEWALFEKDSGRFIGYAGVVKVPGHPDDAELAYALHKEFWNKGYAREIGRAVLQWMAVHTDRKTIPALIFPENTASKKVVEALGMKAAGDTVPESGRPHLRYEANLGNTIPVISGDALLGSNYEPLFPYFEAYPNAFRILNGSDFITEGEGTGIVHMAPGFGEDDQRVCAENGIELVVPVDEKGRYTDEIFDLPDLRLRGLNVVAETKGKTEDEPYTDTQLQKFGLVNLRIIDWLKQRGRLIAQESYKHNYPHCWRTDTPLIYRAMPSWYVKVTAFRDRAVELNRQINWIPEHIRDGQMGHMLATAPDWSISRNRFWGTPIPIWRSDNPSNDELYVFGSIAELEEFFGQKVEDLHRPYIDELTRPDPQDPQYTIRRVDDVFDCWFESGSMPFAQVHYPFENKEWFESHFPADFITEYVAQTRGWFNTMIILSTALFDKPPFKNCICHGVVIDAETGLKYSKRLKNYKDPLEVIDAYGADALRWLMVSSPVMRAQDLAVDPEGAFIRDVVRLAIKPIWNAYNFFVLYANADGVKARQVTTSENLLDRYILAKCGQALARMQSALDAYDTPTACQAVSQFFEVLNNWYIRRSRERFWRGELDADKQAAYDTLYTVLTTMARAAAPLLPLTLEHIYRGLTGEESVHLADFPDPVAFPQDDLLVAEMDKVQEICTAIHAIRNDQRIRTRQPLAGATIYAKQDLSGYADLIADECNIKRVAFSAALDNVADRQLKVHFPVVGKRLPQAMKTIIGASKSGDWAQNPDGTLAISGETLLPEEFELTLKARGNAAGSQPLPSNDALVVLDLTISDELRQEGFARDIVRMVQQGRKDAGLNISDRIRLTIAAEGEVAQAVERFGPYIAEQTLANGLSLGQDASLRHRFAHKLEDADITIALEPVAA